MADDPTLDGDAPATPAAEAPAPQGKRDLSMIVGLVLGFGALFMGMILEGTSPLAYLEISAAIIVFGGTMGAVITSVGLTEFKRIPSYFKYALNYQPVDRGETITTLVAFAEKARREGLLVLEDDIANASDPFLRKGVQLVVDGTDPDLVKEILQTEVDSLAEEKARAAGVFATAGGFSPTLGIIGTVMGLVNVLAHLSDAASLGPAIAVAFVATFYGVCFANLVYLPIGMKIAACSEDEISGRELTIEGILAIQSGDNPRIVEEKLVAFMTVDDREEFHAEQAGDPEEFDLAA